MGTSHKSNAIACVFKYKYKYYLAVIHSLCNTDVSQKWGEYTISAGDEFSYIGIVAMRSTSSNLEGSCRDCTNVKL